MLERIYIKEINNVCNPKFIVGYGSFFLGKKDSDFDVLTIVDNYENGLNETIGDITINFHDKYKLPLDFDVPYNMKTLYTKEDINNALLLLPFPFENKVFFVPKISKNPAFLGSYQVKLRLLIHAFTCKSQKLLFGEKEEFNNLVLDFSRSLLTLILGKNKLYFGEIIDNLLINPIDCTKESLYLGYKERDRITLEKNIKMAICSFLEEGKIYKTKEGKYFLDKYYLTNFIEKQKKIITNKNFGYSFKNIDFSSKNIIDFSQNTNPLGPINIDENFLKNILLKIQEYPDYTNFQCNLELANFIGINIKNLTVCQGSLEAIFKIPEILEIKPNALNIVPTYWGYAASIIHNKGCIENYNLNQDNFNIDTGVIKSKLEDKNICYLCNPNNPTSSYINKEILIDIIRDYPGCHFIIDESHLLLSEDFFEETLSKHVTEFKNLSVIYSLSKFFNIPGLRVGLLVSNANLIESYKNNIVPYSLNTISQELLIYSLKDKKFIENTPKKLKKIREEMFKNLSKVKWLKIFPSKCNFFLCKILDNKISSFELYNFLKKYGLIIRECKTIYNELNGEWIRISINTPKNNNTLVKYLHKFYEEKNK